MGTPAITVRNLQRRVALDRRWLQRFATIALAECLGHSDDDRFALQDLEEIAVAIVSDARIAEIHLDFMSIPGATDVITFDHGDIVVSAETARTFAAEYETPLLHEVALYIVHGLLHLNGFDDHAPAARARMHATQDRILQACLRQLHDE